MVPRDRFSGIVLETTKRGGSERRQRKGMLKQRGNVFFAPKSACYYAKLVNSRSRENEFTNFGKKNLFSADLCETRDAADRGLNLPIPRWPQWCAFQSASQYGELANSQYLVIEEEKFFFFLLREKLRISQLSIVGE